MPLLRKAIPIPVTGIDFSQPATFIDPRAGFPVNMRHYRSEMRKRPGKILLNEVVADGTQIMGLGKLELASSKLLVRASKTKLEKLNTSSNTWDSIANTAFTGGDEDFFHFTNVTESGLLIIANGFDRLRKWTGSGNNSILGGSPPIAKYVAYLSPYLCVAHIDDGVSVKPWKVQWSDSDAPEVWTGGNSGEALLSNEPSPIQNIMQLNEFLATYKKDSLWLGHKVDTSEIIHFDCIKTGIGLGSPRAVAEFEGQHAFMSLNDFYVWNGIQESSIGKAVRDEIFSRINRTKINRCFALHIQELTEIWFFIVISGYDWPTEVWKYNYRTGYWYQDTCDELTAAIKWEAINTQSWDDDPGTWDSAQDVWDSGTSLANWEDIVFGNSEGNTLKLDYTTVNDDGVAVSAYFITKDFTGDILEFNKRWLQFDVWAKGPGKLYVDFSIDEGSNWTNIPYQSASVPYADMDGVPRKYTFWFDKLADKCRFRIRNANVDETFYVRNICPYYIVKEGIR